MEGLLGLLAVIVAIVVLVALRRTGTDKDGISVKADQPRPRPRGVETLPPSFVVADTETTGLSSDRNHIIEIAAVRVVDGVQQDSFRSLVKLPPRKRLSPKITKLTGITREMLATEGRDLTEVMHEFLAFVGDDLLVFYNAKFDVGFLMRAASAVGRPLPQHVACAYQASRAAWPHLRRFRLVDVAEARGVNAIGAHRALADCIMTAAIYPAAVAEAGWLGQVRT
jgi:DNA polymerase III epsilon subunit family exonuclease